MPVTVRSRPNSPFWPSFRKAGAPAPFRPTCSELVRGAALVGGSLLEHTRELAISLCARFDDHAPGYDDLRLSLTQASGSACPDRLLGCAAAFRRQVGRDPFHATELAEAAAHLEYLAAVAGNTEAARLVAAEAVARAELPVTPDDEALDLVSAALGWLVVAAHADPGDDLPPARLRAAGAAERVFDRVAAAWRQRIAERAICPVVPGADPFAALRDILPLPAAPADDVPEEAREVGGVVVLQDIGNPDTGEGRRIRQAFDDLLGRELPLRAVPDLAATRRHLAAAHPHAATVADAVLKQLAGRDHVRLPPIVLVGPPGCGKTSFARDLFEALDVPHALYACGASSDSSLAGTSRRWTTAEPSLPMSLVAAHGTASPGVILDELEKAATGAHNGHLHDALLGLLEPQSSSAWHDPYLQASVDLSHVVWIATANSLEGVPAALRDRCRILAFPAPTGEHLPALAPRMLRRACEERGLDPRWAVPLDGDELRAVAKAWGGGSLRRLGRLMEGVLAARDMAPWPN